MQNKKKVFTTILIMIVAAAGFWMLGNPMVTHHNRELKKAVSQIKKQKTVLLNEVIPFEWDRVYTFPPYTEKEEMEKEIGIRSRAIRETENEGMVQLIFVKGKKITASVCGYENQLGYNIIFDKVISVDEKAVFDVKKTKNLTTLTQRGAGMYIEPARFSKEEKNLMELITSGRDRSEKDLCFDFVTDQTVQSVELKAYQLKKNEWKPLSGDSSMKEDLSVINGRIYLSYDKMLKGITAAIQADGKTDTGVFKNTKKKLPKGNSMVFLLTGREKISYGEEIPLSVQVISSEKSLDNYGLSGFGHPEQYKIHKNQGVYAVSVRFTQKTDEETDRVKR